MLVSLRDYEEEETAKADLQAAEIELLCAGMWKEGYAGGVCCDGAGEHFLCSVYLYEE